MKIELNENKVFFNNGESVQEIHPFWLRERVDGDEFLGLGLDNDNQEDESEERMIIWAELIRDDFK